MEKAALETGLVDCGSSRAARAASAQSSGMFSPGPRVVGEASIPSSGRSSPSAFSLSAATCAAACVCSASARLRRRRSRPESTASAAGTKSSGSTAENAGLIGSTGPVSSTAINDAAARSRRRRSRGGVVEPTEGLQGVVASKAEGTPCSSA
eukprot:scaffold13391_cov65-Phaeocystis_antarctica.AAC.6